MNELVGVQRQQVESFQATTQSIKDNILDQVNEKVDQKVKAKMGKISKENSFQTLRDQAFANRFNLVLTGLEEAPNQSTIAVNKKFFQTLGLKNLSIKAAQRLGSSRNGDTSYRRPLLVQFARLSNRNLVWKKRSNVTSEEGSQ